MKGGFQTNREKMIEPIISSNVANMGLRSKYVNTQTRLARNMYQKLVEQGNFVFNYKLSNLQQEEFIKDTFKKKYKPCLNFFSCLLIDSILNFNIIERYLKGVEITTKSGNQEFNIKYFIRFIFQLQTLLKVEGNIDTIKYILFESNSNEIKRILLFLNDNNYFNLQNHELFYIGSQDGNLVSDVYDDLYFDHLVLNLIFEIKNNLAGIDVRHQMSSFGKQLYKCEKISNGILGKSKYFSVHLDYKYLNSKTENSYVCVGTTKYISKHYEYASKQKNDQRKKIFILKEKIQYNNNKKPKLSVTPKFIINPREKPMYNPFGWGKSVKDLDQYVYGWVASSTNNNYWTNKNINLSSVNTLKRVKEEMILLQKVKKVFPEMTIEQVKGLIFNVTKMYVLEIKHFETEFMATKMYFQYEDFIYLKFLQNFRRNTGVTNKPYFLPKDNGPYFYLGKLSKEQILTYQKPKNKEPNGSYIIEYSYNSDVYLRNDGYYVIDHRNQYKVKPIYELKTGLYQENIWWLSWFRDNKTTPYDTVKKLDNNFGYEFEFTKESIGAFVGDGFKFLGKHIGSYIPILKYYIKNTSFRGKQKRGNIQNNSK